MSIPKGTVERFDEATGGWIQMEHPAAGTGMDYLGAYSNVQELPRGKTVTLRYRVALDASMTSGEGGVEAVAVTPEPLVQIGNADLAFHRSELMGSGQGPSIDNPLFWGRCLPSRRSVSVVVSASGAAVHSTST
jgi:hypothetical protein